MTKILIGAFLSVCLLSCATYSYEVYILRYKEGRLNGKDPSKDLPISVCDDTPNSKANCYVMLRADYIQLRSDYIEMKRQLDACQRK